MSGVLRGHLNIPQGVSLCVWCLQGTSQYTTGSVPRCLVSSGDISIYHRECPYVSGVLRGHLNKPQGVSLCDRCLEGTSQYTTGSVPMCPVS